MNDNKDEINAEEDSTENTIRKIEGCCLFAIAVLFGWLFLSLIDTKYGFENPIIINFPMSLTFSFLCLSIAKLIRHEFNRTKAQ